MLNNKYFNVIFSSLVLIGFIFAGVEDELKKINKKLDNISVRLQNLEKKVAAPAKPANNKKQADPNAVYNIPISNSIVLGNPDAKITVMEWTDFQ